MPLAPIVNSENLVGFLLNNFKDAYDRSEVAQTAFLEGIADEWGSERRTETYGYTETAPYPKRWARGQGRRMSAFNSVSWSTSAVDWSVGVQWHKNDAEDNQLKDTLSKASQAGSHWGSLKTRVVTQMLEGATNFDLLAAVPNAPDGAALFATTAGGSARFGVTGGNLLTGNAVTTSEAITKDFYLGLQQFLLMLDTEGMPLWDPSVLDAGVLVIAPIAAMKMFYEAFKLQLAIRTADATGAPLGTVVTAVAQSNLATAAGVPVTLWFNPLLTDSSDWYMALKGSPVKPFYRQIRRELQSHYQDDSNSDEARTEKIHALMWDSREGYGIGPAYSILKINN